MRLGVSWTSCAAAVAARRHRRGRIIAIMSGHMTYANLRIREGENSPTCKTLPRQTALAVVRERSSVNRGAFFCEGVLYGYSCVGETLAFTYRNEFFFINMTWHFAIFIQQLFGSLGRSRVRNKNEEESIIQLRDFNFTTLLRHLLDLYFFNFFFTNRCNLKSRSYWIRN